MHPQDEREWQTRKHRIDGRLEGSRLEGRPLRRFVSLGRVSSLAIEEYSTDYGPADCVLVAKGRIFAVV